MIYGGDVCFYAIIILIAIIAIFLCVALFYWILILKKIAGMTGKIDRAIDELKEKIRLSALLGIFGQITKETISFFKAWKEKNVGKK
ncbi:MAG: hypothetical protein AAB465_00380 [Patescibacteria group bacterium]